jgi:hypothetical protein
MALEPDQEGKLILAKVTGAWNQRFSFDDGKIIHHLSGKVAVVNPIEGSQVILANKSDDNAGSEVRIMMTGDKKTKYSSLAEN